MKKTFSMLALGLLLVSSHSQAAVPNDADLVVEVLTSYPGSGEEFRCVLDKQGRLLLDANYWDVGPQFESEKVWMGMGVKLSGFSASKEDWRKGEREKTVYQDNHGGKWAIRLADAKFRADNAVCEEKTGDSGRCYYLFPSGDFAGYKVRWSNSQISVLSAMTKKEAAKRDAARRAVGADVLGEARRRRAA